MSLPQVTRCRMMMMMKTQILVAAFVIIAFASRASFTVDAFGSFLRPSSVDCRPQPSAALPEAAARRARLRLRSRESDEGGGGGGSSSDRLLSLLTDDVDGAKGDNPDKISIKDEITSLETSFRLPSEDGAGRFDPLIGLYEVKSVLTRDEKDNPVGGKWTRNDGLAQKLFRTRATYQHLVPLNATGLSRPPGADSRRRPKEPNPAGMETAAVAEAINVISLDAFGGLLRASIVLRGDAVPLSARELAEMNANRSAGEALTGLAVRAYFDPPRIFLGGRTRRVGAGDYWYLPLQIGPETSVVLDTSFYDGRVRVGVGGTSGTRFVFAFTEGKEAREYEGLLERASYIKKGKLIGRLGGVAVASLFIAIGGIDVSKWRMCMLQVVGVMKRALDFASDAKITSVALGMIKRVMPGVRFMAGIVSLISGIGMLLVLFSTGGIERDGISQTPLP